MNLSPTASFDNPSFCPGRDGRYLLSTLSLPLIIFQISISRLSSPSLLPTEKPSQSLNHSVSPLLSAQFPIVQSSLQIGREQTTGRIHQGLMQQHPACCHPLTTHGSPATQQTCPLCSSPRYLLGASCISQASLASASSMVKPKHKPPRKGCSSVPASASLLKYLQNDKQQKAHCSKI